MTGTEKNIIVKVCGMRDAANIRAVEAIGIDLMGFIFYLRSSRYVDTVPEYMPTACERVGVFVDVQSSFIKERIDAFGLDRVQLHGHESPEFCAEIRALGIPVIKALPVAGAESLRQAQAYEGTCDMLLFDTACASHGGSGTAFDWSVLADYHGTTPFLLSGGIAPDSAEELSRFSHPRWRGIDINSRFETAPALKDPSAISHFLTELKSMI